MKALLILVLLVVAVVGCEDPPPPTKIESPAFDGDCYIKIFEGHWQSSLGGKEITPLMEYRKWCDVRGEEIDVVTVSTIYDGYGDLAAVEARYKLRRDRK